MKSKYKKIRTANMLHALPIIEEMSSININDC